MKERMVKRAATDDDFRAGLVRLAYNNEDLRKHLLPIVRLSYLKRSQEDDDSPDWEDFLETEVENPKPEDERQKDKVKLKSLPEDSEIYQQALQEYKEQGGEVPDEEKEEDDEETDEGESGDDQGLLSSMTEKARNIVDSAKEKVGEIAQEQKEFFADDAHQPGSSERESMGDVIKGKTTAVMKSLKHEGEEWKEAVSGIKDLATGGDLDDSQKEGLQTVATHAAIAAGMLAVMKMGGGGHGHHGGHGMEILPLLKHFGKKLAMDSVAIATGKGLIFGSALSASIERSRSILSDDQESMSDEEAKEKLVEFMQEVVADMVQEKNLSEEQWTEILTQANQDDSEEEAREVAENIDLDMLMDEVGGSFANQKESSSVSEPVKTLTKIAYRTPSLRDDLLNVISNHIN